MSKRFRVQNESLNSYGFWVKTSGLDLTDFKKNPICLWNHNRGWRGSEEDILPIGIWTDLKVDGEEITAIPEIDTEDPFAAKIATKVEKGHIKAASIGIQILEWSDDPALLKTGQTRPTVTKSRLFEISICDIPSNKDSVVLYDVDGDVINLSDAGGLQKLPTLQSQPVTTDMEELKLLAVTLGLPATATLSEVQGKIAELLALRGAIEVMKAELKAFKDAQAEARKVEAKNLLDAAVSDNRIPQAQRSIYETLMERDFDSTKALIDGLPKVAKLSEFPAGNPGGGEGAFTFNGKTFSQLSKDDPKLLETLKANDIATFKQLYKAEFGKEYKETVR